MRRLPGDPSIVGWLLFAIGFRLPPANRSGCATSSPTRVGAGGRSGRLLVLMVPICIALAFLPGPPWLRVAVPLFALIASIGTVAISAADIRAARLHQHDLPVPNDPDIGRPAH